MTFERTRRASPLLRIWLAVLIWAACGLAVPAGAQVPPDTIRRDTVPGDTLVVPIPPQEVAGDTLPPDSLMGGADPDSLGPAPLLPAFEQPFPVGAPHGRWEWDREELLRFHGLSLLDLLERIPGMVVSRAGGYGRPAGVSFLGWGGGRVRLFRDGFEMDPLVSATPDLQQVGLVDLDRVRVERTLSEIRVELSSFRIPDRRPYSLVEAGAGNYEAKILRALFARPVGSRGVVNGAYELTTTSGFGVDEPYSFGSGRLRWSHLLGESTGLEAEFRLATVEREGARFREESDRRELILRGRTEPFPGLSVEGLVARAWRVPGRPDEESTTTATNDPFEVDLAATQGMLRAGYRTGFGYLEGTARVRQGDPVGPMLPTLDLSTRAVLQPLPLLAVEAEARATSLDEGQAVALHATGRFALPYGLSAFASLAAGERWAGVVRDSFDLRVDTIPATETTPAQVRTDTIRRPEYGAVRQDAGGLRAGVEWRRGDATLGAAFLTSPGVSVVPTGLAFDRGVPAVAVDAVTGFEAYGSVALPILRRAARVEGWFTSWTDVAGRPYLPQRQGRLALELHGMYYDGQLEPTLRVEGEYRGSALAPTPDASGFGVVTEPYALANLFLQIRILDVRAFFIMENLLNNRTAADLQGATPVGLALPGPRMLYGVRWHFRN